MRSNDDDRQKKINQAEWENLGNWSDTVVGVYFSKKDSRVWVPKRVPSFGWTVNLGRPAGAWWLVGLLALPPIAAALLGRRRR
ncbi:MAG: hypothetical protein H0U67_02065 [Gemmatimonadetes bacterium]|nr:hypothetical protein [Gemmatimonadota bacterium]